MKKVNLIEDKQGGFNVLINGINFGVFDDAQGDLFAFYPRRTERLTGDDYIAIGKALNKLNESK